MAKLAPPTAADYRVLAGRLYDAADDVRAAHQGDYNALDWYGWEAERAAEELEELEG